ncbi:MAG: hypothetical protein OWQ54_09260 [Sulfolobaceae archaeon]|nr:hypothetical protein [Sulfolobaceae archaeon]
MWTTVRATRGLPTRKFINLADFPDDIFSSMRNIVMPIIAVFVVLMLGLYIVSIIGSLLASTFPQSSPGSLA